VTRFETAPGGDRAPLGPRLLTWHERHGRTDLPWQRDPGPFRVWVSEIMLQQTRVSTVIEYFERFVARFPDAAHLAAAEVDAVLHLWSGLGYYARARNLHRAARIVRERHGGALPEDLESLMALPGIGRSTAGAILALAHGQRHPILDGNVKRVLCRYHGLEGWPGNGAVARRLWDLADRHTPDVGVARYTQAIMDVGATLCTRARPSCQACPLARDCHARMAGRTESLPTPRPRREPPLRETVFVVVRDRHGRVLLERRPPVGIWGGLWSFPECATADEVSAWCRRELGAAPRALRELPEIRHGFTHFRLNILPVLVDPGTEVEAGSVLEGPERLWYKDATPAAVGLAAPVAALLERLCTSPDHRPFGEAP
jgi:A/G-specific adenine glycosylase